MAATSIPTAIADISPEWLTEVLRDSGTIGSGTRVTGFTAQQIGLGVGIMGDIHRLALTYDGDTTGAPASVVVKQTSPFEANREQGVALGLYMAEVRFYTELAKETALRIPLMYHADLGEDGAFVVVMEDLSDLRGLDQIVGMTVEEMTHAVRMLAALHGPWWGRVEHLDWIPSIIHERIHGFAAAFPMFWGATKERFADRLDPDRIAVGDAVAVHYLDTMHLLAERTWTLIHMDFRCDNFLYDDADPHAPLVTLDWQSLGRGPAVYDLAYLLGGSLTIEDRRTHETALLHTYHDALVAHRVTDYAFDDLYADYRLASLVGMGSAVLVGGGLDMGNERGVALIGSMVERHFALPVDLSALDLLP